MSYPNKDARKKCWDARDQYWKCLDEADSAESAHKLCAKLRSLFTEACPSQWVKHFDRKKEYLIFKERIEKEGYEPINESCDK